MKTVKPRKQRRLVAVAAEKERQKFMGATLSEKLREKYGVRSIPVRKDDTVKILRGDFAGIEGKVIETDHRKQRVTVEGVTREKVSGEQKRVPVHVSKVMITNLNLNDSWRSEKLERKTEEAKSEEPKETA